MAELDTAKPLSINDTVDVAWLKSNGFDAEGKKVRRSKNLWKRLGRWLGPEVKAIAEQYGVHTMTVRVVSAETKDATLFNSEGQRSWVFHRGQSRKVETVSEHTMGFPGLNMDVCGQASIPADSAFVEVTYLAKYFLRLTIVV